MLITDKDIEKFQVLYKRHCNEDIYKEKARENLTSLVNLVKLIYRPIKKSDFE